MSTHSSKMTLSQMEQGIIDAQYGKDAKPILIADKSIAGLIKANMAKKSYAQAWNILKLIRV